MLNMSFWSFLSLLCVLMAIYLSVRPIKAWCSGLREYFRIRKAAHLMNLMDRGRVTLQGTYPLVHPMCGTPLRIAVDSGARPVRYCYLCYCRLVTDTGKEAPPMRSPEVGTGQNVVVRLADKRKGAPGNQQPSGNGPTTVA